jgi:hypothetical protein
MNEMTSQQLPSGPSTLCFNKEDFMKDDFNVEHFVVECRRKVPLEMLRSDLHVYLKILQSAMIELINKDYADFVNLSTNLVGMDKAINNLLNPLMHLKNEVLNVRNAIIEVASAVEEKMAYLARIREKKDHLRTLMCMVQSVEKMEKLLGIKGHGGTVGDRTQYSSELSGQLIERVATEFNRLQFYVSKSRNLPLVDELKPRIAGITMTLQYGLEASLREGLTSGSVDVLRECLRTYATIDKMRDAENLFRTCVIKPYMEEIINEHYIQTHRHGLLGMYNAILDFYPKHCSKLCEITSGSGQSSGSAVSGYDFMVNAVWPEVVANIEARTPSIFAPGNPNVFHEKYTVSIEFVERFERLCSSQASVKQLRAHPSYGAFMSKWSLSVYFQIRFQEIAGSLETSLFAPFTEATDDTQPFHLQCSAVLWQQLQRCWDRDIFLQPLCHRFWKLTLQLLSRYATWMHELQEEASKSYSRPENAPPFMVKTSSEVNLAGMVANASSTNLPVSASVVSMTSTVAHASSSGTVPSISVSNLVAVISDVQCIAKMLPEFFTTVVVPQLTTHVSNDNVALLRDSLKDSEDALLSQLPQLESFVTNEITAQCIVNLKAVTDIPRLYRRTNRDVPSRASAYVLAIVRPAIDFLDEHKDVVRDENRQRWVSTIMHSVAEQYLAVTSDVLTSVKKMEESLKRLKAARGTSSAGGAQGMSDDDKIRLQLYLDVKEFGTQMAVAGLNSKDLKSYSKLYELTNSAVNSNNTAA